MAKEDTKAAVRELEDTTDKEAELAAASENREQEEISLDYTVKLREVHRFEGNEYWEIDLAGVRKLTTRDAEMLDKTMQLLKYQPGANKFYDTLYMKQLAVRATGKPIEFFNSMSMKNFETVKSRLLLYFLYE